MTEGFKLTCNQCGKEIQLQPQYLHFYGYDADIERIEEDAEKHGINIWCEYADFGKVTIQCTCGNRLTEE